MLSLLSVVCLTANSVATPPPFGAYDPVFTPFHANGTLNIGAIAPYANFTHTMGTDTVILGGSTGEWPSMTTEERIATLVAWRAALDALPARPPPAYRPRPRLMFHAGDIALQRAKQLAAAAQAHGADAILVVAPCIMRPASLDVLVRVISDIAAQAPRIPSWYYHYPSLYNVDFPMGAFTRAALGGAISALSPASATAAAIPTLQGIKYIDTNFSDTSAAAAAGQAAGGRYASSFGFASTQLTVPSLTNFSAGFARGAIVYTPAARFVAAAAVAYNDHGDMAAAAALDARVEALYAIFHKYGSTKAVARAAVPLFAEGLDLGPPRLPLLGAELNTTSIEQLRADLVAAGFL